MPNYEICYVDGGSLVGTISTECASPKQAAILAHALKFREFVQVEVWQGEKLTYVRPAMSPAQAAPQFGPQPPSAIAACSNCRV